MTKDESDATGTLVLVVGASGVGKDTLIDAARRHFSADGHLVFPKRVITRAHQADEPHIAVSEEEFGRLEADGALFLSWQAHDTSYGIPIRARRDLEAGRTVIVNVSRTAIEPARKLWSSTQVIHVTVGPDILKDRLLARRRESQRAVERRLRRADAIAVPQEPWVDEVDNSGDIASAVARFTALIAGYGGEHTQSGSA
ncbi:MAG: phosphonate metabolism protein/1,5-bisphosphokinase (PRPP-forming) PhnN [Methyloligellaceae bacterium]